MSYVGKVTAGGSTHLVGSTLYGICSTDGDVAAKVVTCPNFDQLIEGVTIHVKFANRNTAKTITMNANNTGAKPLVWDSSDAVATSEVPAIATGSVHSFTYDGTSWVSNGIDTIFKNEAFRVHSYLSYYTTDLNDATVHGAYTVQESVEYSNLPAASVSAGILLVFRSTTSGQTIFQVFQTQDSNNNVFYRRSGDGGATWSAWDQICDIDAYDALKNESLKMRSTVESGTNINTITGIGIYYLSGSSTYTNLPSGISYGILIVERPNLTGTLISQRLCPCDSAANTYTRVSSNSGSSWTAWRRFIKDNDLEADYAKVVTKSVTKQATTNITLANNSRVGIDVTGGNANVCFRIIANVASNGAIAYQAIGTHTNVTVSASTNTLTIDNQTTTNATAYITVYSGSAS